MSYLKVPRSQAALLITAVQDAIRYQEGFLKSDTVEDVTEYESQILALERLAQSLRESYIELKRAEPTMPEYSDLVPPARKQD